MAYRIRHKRYKDQEAGSTRAYTYRKTCSVPEWEKRFCSVIGRMQWKDFLEVKKKIWELNKVMRWDDSAGKECFEIAKSRFWANNGGPPCNIALPCQDMYIDDQIDWNAKIDPQLVMQLEDAARQAKIARNRTLAEWNNTQSCFLYVVGSHGGNDNEGNKMGCCR